jgi:DNA repair protein RadA/Sms
VQALVTRSPSGGTPRRSVTDLDSGRVAMLLAVLTRHGRINFSEHEVYAGTVGGMRATEPATDLAIALALTSAARDSPLPQTLCAIGEVSLSGDVRRVSGIERRLAEAARLGFTVALVPGGHDGAPPGNTHGVNAVQVATLPEAMAAAAEMGGRIAEARRPALRTIRGGAPA